jgi:chemotaxis protein methyltransferase CheR
METVLAKPVADLDYEIFQKHVKEKTGIDLSAYKRPQMERRLRSLAEREGARSLREYVALLERRPELVDSLRSRITINVSELFRNPDRFLDLQNRILPQLAAQHAQLQIWSAGCSYGAEAYSVAMILEEMGLAHRARILATDIDEEMLARGKAGIFSLADVRNVSSERLRRCFVSTNNGYQVADRVRSQVEFRHHDLLKDNFGRGFNLVICRNVVIYFTEETKRELYNKFWKSLTPQGVLFIGSTEYITQPYKLGYESIGLFFYRRIPQVTEEN